MKFPPQLFRCKPTIENVRGARGSNEYVLLDQQARLYAGAIGWSGAGTRTDGLQEITYPSTDWSWGGKPKTANDVAHDLMRFNIGVMAAMDESGKRIVVFGSSPRVAERVTAQWKAVIAGLLVTPSVHLFALICVAMFAGTAVILDESFLSNAQRLRSILNKPRLDGSLLTGKELAGKLSERKHHRVRYAAVRLEDIEKSTEPRFQLCLLSEDRDTELVVQQTWLSSETMPEGTYD